jgi:hypothetical protein
MSADADHVWQRAVDDARPRPRELHRAEQALTDAPVGRTPKLGSVLLPPKRYRKSWRTLVVATAAICTLASATIAWVRPDIFWPENRATPEDFTWATAITACLSRQTSDYERSRACNFVDDALHFVATETAALIDDAEIGAAVREARANWASAFVETQVDPDAPILGDPYIALATLTDSRESLADRRDALAHLQAIAAQGIFAFRASAPTEGDARVYHESLRQRLVRVLR